MEISDTALFDRRGIFRLSILSAVKSSVVGGLFDRGAGILRPDAVFLFRLYHHPGYGAFREPDDSFVRLANAERHSLINFAGRYPGGLALSRDVRVNNIHYAANHLVPGHVRIDFFRRFIRG